MRILELFAGYGSQALALENLGIDFISEISEIDKYAIDAYNQIHGKTHNWGDITKIDETKLPYYDLITYSSPCQDFSVAGLGKGGDAGSGTRSSLLWECERIIRAVKPKYLLMENVKNLVGKKHKHNFIRWLRVLESLGYQNFWKVLNAKDYGVPQNRERVFVVSILGCGQFIFPNPIKLEKRLKDVLEPEVDEKYYLSSKLIEGFLKRTEQQKKVKGGYIFQPSNGDGVSKTLTGCNDNRITDNYIIEPNVLTPKRTEYGKQIRKDYESGTVKESRHNMTELEPRDDGISNTLTSVLGANYVIVPEETKQDYTKAYEGDSINLDQPNSKTRRGRVGRQIANTLTCVCSQAVVQHIGNCLYPDKEYGTNYAGALFGVNGIAPVLNTTSGGNRQPFILKDHRIRKLTPREYWRLMGVKDEQYDKLHGISNTQLYKMAGNSIVVDVLMAIFKNLFQSDEETCGQLTLL